MLCSSDAGDLDGDDDGDVTWPADTLTDVGPRVEASTATLGILFHVHSFINHHTYNWLNQTKHLH